MQKRVLLLKPVESLPGAEETLAQSVEILRWDKMDESDRWQALKSIHGIVASKLDVTEEMIQNAPLLEAIVTPQAGYDNVDVEAATRAGVPVVSNSGAAAESVAEFTLGLMIALARRIVKSDRDLHKSHDWKIRETYADLRLDVGSDLRGKTVGIIGFGYIGSAVARLCRRAFSCRILAYDPFVTQERMGASGAEKAEDLLAMVREIRFLLIHVALTQATHHLVNEAVLKAMRRDAFLVNCARGSIVDENALVKALKEGWISGAALDVFEKEPISPDNPLLDMDNVIMTPHIAVVTREAAEERGAELVKRVLGVLAGERPEGLANPEVWPHFLQRRQH